MAKKDILSLLLLIIILKLSYISSYIILPFNFSSKYKNNNDFSDPKSYFEYYMYNTIYTNIKVDDKLIRFKLSMDVYATYVSDNIYIPKNEEGQEVKIDKNYTLNYINLNKVKMFNDSFDFNIIENNKSISELKNIYKFNNYSFFRVSKYTDDSIKEEAVIGLNRVKGSPFMVIRETSDHWGCKYEEDTNLIGQLKSRKIINSTIFSIKYNNLEEEEEKGEIILGEFPHGYDQKNYIEKNLYYNKVTCYTCPPFNYYSSFTELLYDNKTIEARTTFQISVDHGFIEASLKSKNIFDEFFQKYNNSCKEEIINNNVHVFYCKEDAIKNFKTLIFYFQNREIYQFGLLNDFKLEFNYNDLFIKSNGNNDIYYFQIIFKDIEDWIFGKPAFKKYRFIFDQNRKMYGIYNNLEKVNDEKEQNNNEGFNKLTLFLVIIIILSVCLVIESIILIKKLIIKRNKRANELKDEYDYNASLNHEENKANIN